MNFFILVILLTPVVSDAQLSRRHRILCLIPRNAATNSCRCLHPSFSNSSVCRGLRGEDVTLTVTTVIVRVVPPTQGVATETQLNVNLLQIFGLLVAILFLYLAIVCVLKFFKGLPWVTALSLGFSIFVGIVRASGLNIELQCFARNYYPQGVAAAGGPGLVLTRV
jgi:hypothetical protein